MDKLCIDQTDADTKMQGISELPAIVSSSEQMLVLLGETYFDRLWCSFELSIFVKLRGLDKLRLVPLWLAPWLLTSLLSSYLALRLTAIYMTVVNEPALGLVALRYDGVAQQAPIAYGASRMLVYLVNAPSTATFATMSFLLVSVVTFPQKLLAHEAMLQDIRCYNIRSAKCSVEEDRQRIQEHVAELFDGLEDPVLAVAVDAANDSVEVAENTHKMDVSTSMRSALRSVTSYLGPEECLDEFNRYVQYSLRDMLVGDLGIETQLSFSHCLLFSLPNILAGIVQVWASRQLRSKLGYASDEQYFAATYLDNLEAVLSFSCLPPCLLRFTACAVARTNPGLPQFLWAVGSSST